MGRHNIAFIVIGVVALTIGIALKLFVGRRRFYRRNQAGLQGFNNYRNAVVIPVVETVLIFIAWLLILVGVVCLTAAVFVGK